ncbi:MAG TPA: hypothetical protein VFA69_08475 [Candidatus Nitrosotalea sp.]|nr:hypothetical protein [Candidatus Nitrosotalea sp.]
MDEKLIKTVEELLADGIGNQSELRHILNLLRQGRPLPRFDRVYLDILVATPTPGYRGSTKYKSEGTSLVLSLFFGSLGFLGIGHRYVGTIGKSLGLLYAGWTLLFLSLLAYIPMVTAAIVKSINPESQSYYSNIAPLIAMTNSLGLANSIILYMILLVIAPIAYLVLFIWQIVDARKETRKFNEFMDRTGQQLYYVTIEKKVAYVLVFCAPLIAAVALAIVVSIFPTWFHK